MALPAHLLAQLPAGVARGLDPANAPPSPRALSLGSTLDAALPDGGLPRGAVVEVAVAGGSALGTRLALEACRAVQAEGRALGGEAPWCAFIDPSASLYAPGVAELGLELERLLVVRPPPEALARVSVRLVESQAFGAVVIDAAGVLGKRVPVELGRWVRVVRRLALAIEGSSNLLVLLTERAARRPLPLPVALRVELARRAPSSTALSVAKERQGRIVAERRVAWPAPPPASAEEGAAHVRRIA
ncbi:MAG: recombinase A [Sorangiineae bacterium]|nr:recombinase A [Polyangiaceae bacterium]MEB2325153.1 recombinase A [Sorangiineae bacterium]